MRFNWLVVQAGVTGLLGLGVLVVGAAVGAVLVGAAGAAVSVGIGADAVDPARDALASLV